LLPLSQIKASGQAPQGAAGAVYVPQNVISGAALQPPAAGVNVSSANIPVSSAAAAAAVTLPPRVAALSGISSVPSARHAEDGPVPHLVSTLEGPGEVKVGDEFSVVLQLQTDASIGHVRAQARFDGAALQLVGGDPGSLVPVSTGTKVTGRSGGAQIDAVLPDDTPITSGGDLLVLKFKALQARKQTAVAAQVAVQGGSGSTVASSTPVPLALAISE
jgi:hypothetical protein